MNLRSQRANLRREAETKTGPRTLANTIGGNPVDVTHLPPDVRVVFDAQLEAFFAAEDLTHRTTRAAEVGEKQNLTDAITRWTAARSRWDSVRNARKDRHV